MSDLHNAIMNIPCVVPEGANINQAISYKVGHKDARHAAAELAATHAGAAAEPSVEQVERELGMGHGSWDMEDPAVIISTVLRLAALTSAPAEPCRTCGASEPYTGTCGTSDSDTRALCKRATQPAAGTIDAREQAEKFLDRGLADVQDEGGVNTYYSKEAVLECIAAALASREEAPPAAGAAQAVYSDNTPQLHIGDSAFEDWYQNYLPNSVGHKQIARDAYAAGMGDPLVTGRAALAATTAPEPFQKALDIRIQQGWQLGGNACPVLYTDTINGEQVRRDDLWLATTAGLKGAPAPASEAVAYIVHPDNPGLKDLPDGTHIVLQRKLPPATETLICNKCGYIGTDMFHAGCNYVARSDALLDVDKPEDQKRLAEALATVRRQQRNADLWQRLGTSSGEAPATPTGDSADAPMQQAGDITDAMVDAYLAAQRQTVEEADKFGRTNVGGLHTNTVREACRNGLRAALKGEQPVEPSGSERGTAQ